MPTTDKMSTENRHGQSGESTRIPSKRNTGKRIPGRWTRLQRDFAIVGWVSFLTASAGTMVIFALVDPAALTEAWALRWKIGRTLGYSLGFAFLWAITAASAALAVFMIRTGPRRGHARGQGRRPPPKTHDPADNNPDLKEEDWW